MPAKKITRSMKAQRIFKAARAMKGLTLEAVGKRFNIAYSTAGKWERDVYGMRLGDFLSLCGMYGIDPVQIIQLKEE